MGGMGPTARADASAVGFAGLQGLGQRGSLGTGAGWSICSRPPCSEEYVGSVPVCGSLRGSIVMLPPLAGGRWREGVPGPTRRQRYADGRGSVSAPDGLWSGPLSLSPWPSPVDGEGVVKGVEGRTRWFWRVWNVATRVDCHSRAGGNPPSHLAWIAASAGMTGPLGGAVPLPVPARTGSWIPCSRHPLTFPVEGEGVVKGLMRPARAVLPSTKGSPERGILGGCAATAKALICSRE